MNHPDLIITNARVVTPAPASLPARGGQMSVLRVLPRASIVVASGRIDEIRIGEPVTQQAARVLDAAGRVVIPGFVDCHTHLCWAGDRLDEWEMKLRGVPYLEILARGGGIMSTVRAVRAATRGELSERLDERLERCLAEGTTTVEIKSGYGLSTRDEIKMLEAITESASRWPGRVVATALLGRAIDPDVPGFARLTTLETLDEVHRCFPACAVDAFIERGAWSLDEGTTLLRRALELGHPVRAHVDQFTDLGGVPMCVGLGAASVDHLEASSPETLSLLAMSSTVGVALPICGLHLDGRFASLRPLIDAGGAAAIATNCNPGSAPSLSMPLAMATAVRKCGLRFEEAVCAATRNGAAVLGLSDAGVIERGARADLCLLDTKDERDLAFRLGGRCVRQVVCGGRVVAG
ncbi:MAG: imidazolonepropionase [Phycisphaerales bacterium]